MTQFQPIKEASASPGATAPASRGGTLGVRTDDRHHPDVTLLAKAIIGHVFAHRYGDRDTANEAMASYPMRHTPSARRPAS